LEYEENRVLMLSISYKAKLEKQISMKIEFRFRLMRDLKKMT